MSGAGDPPRELAQACALPPGYYTGVEMLERDLTRVFARSWQLVARCDQLAGAGDHVVTVVGRTPVLVVRGQRRYATCHGQRLSAPGGAACAL